MFIPKDFEEAALHNLEATLEALHHGIMMINASGEVHVCNATAFTLLNLPADFLKLPFNIADVMPQLANLEILQNEDGSVAELQILQHKFIKIHAKSIGFGNIVLTIEDISHERTGQSAQKRAEMEYRSLFENAVCGIYRDELDGTPVRCNTALATLNGYDTEMQYIGAVTGAHGSWYVEPDRFLEFKRLMATEGRVRDLVSEEIGRAHV